MRFCEIEHTNFSLVAWLLLTVMTRASRCVLIST